MVECGRLGISTIAIGIDEGDEWLLVTWCLCCTEASDDVVGVVCTLEANPTLPDFITAFPLCGSCGVTTPLV